ncbi:type IV pilus biogenesis protein PilP [Collimonas sp.]|jgi:type IV pilus biogenesis protein PilP|uniref:type IV pilus biogenesis protein PilP n=1 Tax=Collimonas sp. TaxID=1963772 RepID=UPI002B663A5F|nr:type IV pilus biogenesis protein PilP [Collimonas sp.]HWW05990.1 type IV pilus biogenesis protein PilP [Collimonas sp.]
MQNKLKMLAAVSALMLAGIASAESTSESLTRIDAETLVLKARERQLEVQVNIVNKQNEILARQTMASVISAPPVVGDPVIRAIEGIGKTMFATLQMNDGSIVDVQSGDILANGMKILSIRSSEVIAQSKNSQRIRLASYAPPAPGFNPSYPGANLPQPALQPQPAGQARGSAR